MKRYFSGEAYYGKASLYHLILNTDTRACKHLPICFNMSAAALLAFELIINLPIKINDCILPYFDTVC